jgi:hypothetical protein
VRSANRRGLAGAGRRALSRIGYEATGVAV